MANPGSRSTDPKRSKYASKTAADSAAILTQDLGSADDPAVNLPSAEDDSTVVRIGADGLIPGNLLDNQGDDLSLAAHSSDARGTLDVLCPSTGSPGSGTAVPLVAGTEYRVAGYVPRTTRFAGLRFAVRVAATAASDDKGFAILRDADGKILSASGLQSVLVGTSGPPGGLASTGTERAMSFPGVKVPGGSIVYACILFPTLTGSPQLYGLNPGTAAAWQTARGGAIGQTDAGSKAGLTTPETVMNAADSSAVGVAPFLRLVASTPAPLRPWANPNAATGAPLAFSGLNESAQVQMVTDRVRVPGQVAAKHTVRPGDVQNGTSVHGERSEYATSNLAFPPLEDVMLYGRSFSVDSDFVIPNDATVAGNVWAIPVQFHAGFPISPPLALDIRPDGIHVNRVPGELNAAGTWIEHADWWETPLIVPGKLRPTVWHDFILRVRWTATLTGEIDVFYKTSDQARWRRVFRRRNVATTQKAHGAADTAAAAPYDKSGLYRSATPGLTNVIYQAPPRRSTSLNDLMGMFGEGILLD